MRPKLRRHAVRAGAAAGALALGVAIALAAAAPQVSTAKSRDQRPRPHHHPAAAQPLRLHARLLPPNLLIGKDIAFIGPARPRAARRVVGVQLALPI